MRHAINWVISDPHFYHQAIIDGLGRPQDCDQQMIRNIKNLVAQQDTLWWLGDIIFYKLPELKKIMGEFKGKHVLIKGNHDKKPDAWYVKNGFDAVMEAAVVHRPKGRVIMTHIPVSDIPPELADVNLHGHLHTNLTEEEHRKKYGENHILFSVERENYTPVNLDQILSRSCK